ncbi:AI-2E family transporter [Arthrobacter pityocampae]|uniref:AI-2E family transporter n=1 Tax=Arthrobacter pityocampae TaxID=547334 RepID=UPI0037352489
MTDPQDVPVDQPLPRPEPAANGNDEQPSAVEARAADRRVSTWRSLFTRVRHALPAAQPRPRFEFPPEVEPTEIAVDRGVSLTDERLKFGDTGAPTMRAHPIHFGFMMSVGVGLALLAFFIITNVGQLLVWIGAALFIALGLDPIVRWFETRYVPRPAGIAMSFLLLMGVVVGFFALLIPTIVSQTSQIVARAPGYANTFLNSEFFLGVDRQFQVRERVSSEIDKFFANSEAVGGIFGGVLGVGTVIVNGLFGALVILVLALYFLASMPGMKKWAYRLAPRSRRARVEVLSEEITRSVGLYVIGQACVALLNGAFAFIVMTFAGVPFSVLLTFVVVLLAFIPLIGAVTAAVLVSLIALTVGWHTALLFAIPYVAYLQFEAYFISPRIMQRAVAVPGSVAVIAVIAGGTLLGVLGALIAIPTAAAAMLLLKEVFIARQDRH